jgi:hypothetical protein
VVGARGEGSLGGLHLGSVAHRLVHEAPCPVVVVPPPVEGDKGRGPKGGTDGEDRGRIRRV